MHTIFPGSHGDFSHLNLPSIFLAGPSRRGEYEGQAHWRNEAIHLLRQMGFAGIIYSPEPMTEAYEKQVGWEDRRLNESTVIAFWVPRDLDELPGFTTNVEFGEWMKSGKAVLGYPQGAPKMRYLHMKAEKYGIQIAHSLFDTMELAERMTRGLRGLFPQPTPEEATT